jgi:hypothetical protein
VAEWISSSRGLGTLVRGVIMLRRHFGFATAVSAIFCVITGAGEFKWSLGKLKDGAEVRK